MARHNSESTSNGDAIETWTMTAEVDRELRATTGTFGVEEGVMLGGNRKKRRITHIYFDHSGRRTAAWYTPDTAALNSALKNDWERRGIELLGFGHSHPAGYTRLSDGDKTYARNIMGVMTSFDSLLLPIFQSTDSGAEYSVWPFMVRRTPNELEFVQFQLEVESDATTLVTPHHRVGDGLLAPQAPARSFAREELFTRVTAAYDLDRLRRCRIISVGCGGSVGFDEDIVRCSVGEVVLIDSDTVSASNIATQMTYVDGVDLPKVEVLAERLRRINPEVKVRSVPLSLDALDDAAFRDLAFGALAPGDVNPPIATLLCGFTDSFNAQARINRLALNFGLPSLCAQVYAQGRGAELTFTHPDTTPACHRCILSSRYEAYLEENFVNTVGSAAAPIFTTTRLNAAKGPLALALLHHGTDHPRWGNLLERIGNRNLVQLRLDPDLALPVFDKTLGKNKRRVLFDEAVWLPQAPERLRPGHRACPDCGGTGKLSQARGTFRDTRVMRN